MRIFISSLISGFESFRDTAIAAVKALDHDVIRAEEFAASPSSPQVACLQGIRNADAVVLLLGERYGDVQPSGRSATHEEFEEARTSKPIFAFVQAGIKPDVRQAAFIADVQGWVTGHFTGSFSDESSLRSLVTRGLHRWELSVASGTVDPDEMTARAIAKLPATGREDRYSSAAALAVALAFSPPLQVLRPSELEAETFKKKIAKEAVYGDQSIFDPSSGTDFEIAGHALQLMQKDRRLSIAEDGSIIIITPLPRSHDGFSAIIQEDVTQQILKSFRFADWVIETIDPTQRLTSVVPAVQLLNAGHSGWKTRSQHRRDNSTRISMLGETEIRALLSPAHRSRAVFRRDAEKIADDLMVLLRRYFKQ